MAGTTQTRLAWAAAAILIFLARDIYAEKIPPNPVDGKIQWVYSYEDGKQQARRTGKPLFVVFRCER